MSDSKSLRDLAEENTYVETVLRGSQTPVQAASAINDHLGYTATSERSVRRWRSKRDVVRDRSADYATKAASGSDVPPPVGTGSAATDPGGDEGTINYTTDTPIETREDWNHVFEIFHLNPEVFEIVDDTVRCKTWQQSKALDDGSRDIVQLYSYGARFRRKIEGMVTPDDVQVIIDRLWDTRYAASSPIRTESEPCTFFVCWADLQLGKDEGGGVASTIARFMSALDATVERINELRAQGRNITRIVVANMGDPIEGCDQNYAQQTFSVELNLRDQLLLALNTFSYGLNRLAELTDSLTFLSVLCNHGEWQRLKGKSFTNDADNASGFLADTLKLIFEGRGDADKFSWVIPRDEMIVSEVFSGVRVAATHGHKMPQNSNNIGGENAWLQNQSMNLLRRHGSEPRLWVTAHRHHGMILDFGPWWRIQCSALDGGSKWFEDASGKWSTPGVTTFLVGTHDARGFSDYAIL